ncbi:hypothetical protein WL00_30760 [Burkholderia cepacia]|nr:hypothetical protein WL00_30760 [Burkholderia cepacia]KVX76305.1 hypothetical protein WL07_03610 [Burkholderia cepacia]
MSAQHDLFAPPAGGDAPAAVPEGSPQVATQCDDWGAFDSRAFSRLETFRPDKALPCGPN